MNLTLIISIYAAAVSTFVAFWRIFEYFNDRNAKVQVSFVISYENFPKENKELDLIMIYCIYIINKGRTRIFIELPNLFINIKFKGSYLTLNSSLSTSVFPLSLEPGDKYFHEFKGESIELYYYHKDATKVRAEVKDTLGKSFLTEWRKI